MPRKQTERIDERKKEILSLVESRGEVSTNDVVRITKLSHSQVFYILKLLSKDGAIKEVRRGKVAYWKSTKKQEVDSPDDTD
ncbi:DNA-binding protein [Thermocladium modestius]|uniref:DNA-binding protein n=1 Tax=Thermocladium modestius TaxID=62609 RepID=A0A830GSK9_9CREN|nr:FaeA/PapI family transcriptional regulator [Thermocladium modestius]GGP18867.1 DNA-binding protein [Thermocladium modestius]